MEPNSRKKEKSNRREINNEEDKVEELLQAAQDDLLLKLSLDSHISRVPPDYLPPDLDRRFQSLKSRPSLPISSSQSQKSTPSVASAGAKDDELKAVLGDELSARFAALKGSLFSSTSSSSSSSSSSTNVIPVGPISSSDDEEDEVEKLIRWAKDAARLDPSPPSDDEEEEEEEEDNREHEKLHNRK